jgi:O-succinylbenzoate synthase
MKIWTHHYELKPREKKMKPRHGALVKIEWVVGQTGYSDVHPWPEFGEAPLEAHIQSLRDLKFTPLVENTMEFNYWDREFRTLKRNAFLGLIIPRSHRLVFDMDTLEQEQLHKWAAEGFTHIKVKMGRDLKSETETLINMAYSTQLLWRVDFNGRISEAEFLKWWSDLDPLIKARIDFIEDPLAEGELKTLGPWANDWKAQERAKIRIIKPARETVEDLAIYDRVVFTHSLDHTFGQACSAWVAARYYMRHPRMMETCGLANTDFFEPDAFSREWNCEGPRMKPTVGTGFGFDKLLAELKWERLL